MGLLSMFGATPRVTLRVTSESGPAAFDALLILDRSRGFETHTFADRRTPFEAQLPNGDVTIVVRPRDQARPVSAEYEVTVADKRQLWVRSKEAMPVLRRHRGGVLGAGLPNSTPPGADGSALGALAI